MTPSTAALSPPINIPVSVDVRRDPEFGPALKSTRVIEWRGRITGVGSPSGWTPTLSGTRLVTVPLSGSDRLLATRCHSRTRSPTLIIGDVSGAVLGGGGTRTGAGAGEVEVLDWAPSALHTIASATPARPAITAVGAMARRARHRIADSPTAIAGKSTPYSLGQRPVPGESSNIDDGHPPRYHRRGHSAWMWGAWSLLAAALVLAGAGLSDVARAQDNYEIQVYGSETVAPEVTMFELHSNFTIDGSTEQVGVVWPTEDAVHETLEITHGFTPWFETGFYVFSSYRAGGQGWDWVGDHIRPRVRAPESWAWPVGVSMSFEFGYNIPQVSPDIWTWRSVRSSTSSWAAGISRSIRRSSVRWRVPTSRMGWMFAPDGTAGYDVTSFVNVAVEYYSRVGYSPAYVAVSTISSSKCSARST